MRFISNANFFEIKVDMRPFREAMLQVLEGATQMSKTLQRNAEARRAITTSSAPFILEGIDI